MLARGLRNQAGLAKITDLWLHYESQAEFVQVPGPAAPVWLAD
jgi:hypothetical protein